MLTLRSLPIFPGMQLSGRWDLTLAEFGNRPDLNQGDVIIELGTPIDGMKSFTAASEKMTISAEGGQVLGLSVVLGDGRRLFVPWLNVTGIIDAPAESKKRKG